MARRQDNHEERPNTTRLLLSPIATRPPNNVQSTDEDEIAVDVDEPPDNSLGFKRLSISDSAKLYSRGSYSRIPSPNVERKESLLTQALLTSPTLGSLQYPTPPMSRAISSISNCSTASTASTAELTSDGETTSPARTNTPSPPLLPMNLIGSAFTSPKALDLNNELKDTTPRAIQHSAISNIPDGHDAVPNRKRCITFACGLSTRSQDKTFPITKADGDTQAASIQPETAHKRPCMLRFVCPTRLSSEAAHKVSSGRSVSPVDDAKVLPDTTGKEHAQNGSPSMTKTSSTVEPKAAKATVSDLQGPPKTKAKNTSEGLRFHEFASRYLEEDEWLDQQPAPRHKITVNDTLRKEDAIRKLGQEAEEEALEEENADAEAELEQELHELKVNDIMEDDDNDEEDDEIVGGFESDGGSDGGNESDNEEGFADSDDESDMDAEYHFWRPGTTTTAATSADNLEHIRPKTQRTASGSSIESVVNFTVGAFRRNETGFSSRKNSCPRSIKMRPGTPDLPDSTDFVCGTLDEDRPLEAAYISCIQQRRLTKYLRSPRDYGPSFPTLEIDEEDEVGEADLITADASDEHVWITGLPDDSDIEGHHTCRKQVRGKRVKSPAPLARRLRSPPPPKNTTRLRSPAAARNRVMQLASPSQRPCSSNHLRRTRSPPLVHMRSSIPSTQAPVSEIPLRGNSGVNIPPLAQIFHPTFTKSLPKTPNPFWRQMHKSRDKPSDDYCAKATDKSADLTTDVYHSRGPIDIIHGLEKKQSLRRERSLRQHCRNGIKEKERRCQPGKGAERMRELGLERAGRCKAIGQAQNLMLSI